LSFGSLVENRLCAPVAVYRAKLHPHDESEQWLFIQHGSYQWISSADQPHVEEGHALIYRGIQTERTFRYPSVELDLQQWPTSGHGAATSPYSRACCRIRRFRSIPSTTGPNVVKPRS
jgi:hypothetical protein